MVGCGPDLDHGEGVAELDDPIYKELEVLLLLIAPARVPLWVIDHQDVGPDHTWLASAVTGRRVDYLGRTWLELNLGLYEG